LARIIKEPLVRRTEILDVAQGYMFGKGYESMTVQDILDELKISKGAFYHYFDSKQNLLEALIERTQAEAAQLLIPILSDPGLPAVEKLQRFFNLAGAWKTARKEYMLALVRVWYQDDNAMVRQKSQAAMLKFIQPLFRDLVRQGIQEGQMQTSCPDQVPMIIMALFQGLGDALVEVILSPEPKPEDVQRLDDIAFAFTDSIERVMGITPGTLKLVDHAVMQEWVLLPTESGQVLRQ
jgi:TetR/AcrR family transcriptional regulator, transcriptional repressor for nem operon